MHAPYASCAEAPDDAAMLSTCACMRPLACLQVAASVGRIRADLKASCHVTTHAISGAALFSGTCNRTLMGP